MSTAPRHWLDRLSSIPMGIPRLYEPIFSGGWGDETVIDAVRSVSAAPPDPPDVDIRWEAHADDSRVGTLIGVDRHRPRDIPPARILQIAPTERRQVILMAASNDHGWQTRSTVAGHLAQAGIGSVILEQPFYGTRRRHAGQPIRTVSEFFLMGAVAVEEARAIMRHLHRAGHVVGVGGFSQGGSMASHVSALAPVPVATACLAAGPSPGPVFTAPGVLASTVDWQALGGRRQAEDRLARLLGDIDATRYPPPTTPPAPYSPGPGPTPTSRRTRWNACGATGPAANSPGSRADTPRSTSSDGGPRRGSSSGHSNASCGRAAPSRQEPRPSPTHGRGVLTGRILR